MSLYHTLYWHVRPWFGGNPLFTAIDDWDLPEPEGPETYGRQKEHYARALKCWEFLRPFFASRGFILYDHGQNQWESFPPANVSDSNLKTIDNYPYGRRFYEKQEEGKFFIPTCLRLWAAQDRLGQDVVIKIVPERELKVLRYLNTAEARADPRNHTIPLIDSGTFSGLSFVVTPRWDGAFGYQFQTVAELMQCTKILLEGLDFLHENRVFHGDILDQNIGMNVALYLPFRTKQPIELRDGLNTRYAYYDFEISVIYPPGKPLEDIYETDYNGFELRGIPRPTGPFKVFPLDVLCLGLLLEQRTKHVESIIPEIVPFLENMVNPDENERSTARQALIEFENIYAKLTPGQLSERPKLRSSTKSRKSISAPLFAETNDSDFMNLI